MAGCAAKNHARKVSLGEAGDNNLTGGGRSQSVGKLLHGCGAGNSIVWVGDVGHFGANGEEVRGDTHGIPATDHGEESEAIGRWYIGDSGGGRSTRGSRNSVG